MTVDVKNRCAILFIVDDVLVPEFVVKCFQHCLYFKISISKFPSMWNQQ
jgi:hypothetical protein